MAKRKDKIVLVVQDSNWADEFDTFGMALFPLSAWQAHLDQVKERFKVDTKTREIYFGTNEAVHHEDFQSYKTSFKVKDISASELATLKKLFKLKVNKVVDFGNGIGQFPILCVEDEITQEKWDQEQKEIRAKYTVPQIYKLPSYEIQEILAQRPEIVDALEKYAAQQMAKLIKKKTK